MSPVPPDLRRLLGMSRYWLRTDLRELDPISDPIAFALDTGQPLGRAINEGLGRRSHGHGTEGWSTRPVLLKVLGELAPAAARALEAAPRTDINIWSVVYGDSECRVAVETFVELGELVKARLPIVCASFQRCRDGGEHRWDAEIVFDDMDWDPDEDGPESACSICGVALDSWMHR
jgi:hypothetical protein